MYVVTIGGRFCDDADRCEAEGDDDEEECVNRAGRMDGDVYVQVGRGGGETCPSDGRLDDGADLAPAPTSGKGNCIDGFGCADAEPEPRLASVLTLPDLNRPRSSLRFPLPLSLPSLLLLLVSSTSLAIACIPTPTFPE